MAGNIKGITIEFRGDTTKLDKALRQINNETRSLDKELRQVDNALKFNPTNIELWRQKQQLLTEKVNETREKLNLLKDAQKQMDASGVDKSSEEYRKLQREIITAESQVKTFEGQLRKVGNVNLQAASQEMKQLGDSMTTAGQAMQGLSVAGAAVVGVLGTIVYKSATAADNINTMAKVYRISTEDLQKYKLTSDQLDVSLETIAKSHTKITKSMNSAKGGTGAAADAFKTLGVDVLDASGNLRSADEVWNDTIKALGQVENETERDALAMQLMGKSAAELNPLIEDNGETYKRVAKLFEKYNLDFIDQETLDNANKFRDDIDDIKSIGSLAFEMMGDELAEYLLPVMEKAVDYVGRFAKWLSNLDPKVLAIIGGISGLLAVLAPLLITFGKLFNGISAVIKVVNLLSGGIGLLSSGALLPIIAVIAAVVAAGVLLYKNWDKIKAFAIQLKDGIINAWNAVKNAVVNAAKAIWEGMTWPYRKAWEFIKDIVKKIKDLFPINIKNFLSNIKLPHLSVNWGEITAFGKTISFPKGFNVDWYAKGGIFNSPTIAGIGESGAEAVIPLDKLWSKMDEIAASSGGPVINVYATPGMDMNQLAAKIEAILVKQQKQRSMAYGGI